jgi:hypothetical protein
MTGKHYQWHKAWARDAQGHLVHTSGLKVLVVAGDGFTDLETDDASVVIFRASEQARGVPAHQLNERLQRLIKEAQTFWEHSQ